MWLMVFRWIISPRNLILIALVTGSGYIGLKLYNQASTIATLEQKVEEGQIKNENLSDKIINLNEIQVQIQFRMDDIEELNEKIKNRQWRSKQDINELKDSMDSPLKEKPKNYLNDLFKNELECLEGSDKCVK